MPRRRDENGHRQRHQHEFRRGGQTGRDVRQHRLSGCQRGTEIAARQVCDIADELHRQRLIQPEPRANFRDRGLRRRGPGEIGGGISRQHPGQQKRYDDDADDARQGGRHAAADRAQSRHGVRLSPASGSPDGGGTSIDNPIYSAASPR